jgi:hypothetical protein
MYQEGLQ